MVSCFSYTACRNKCFRYSFSSAGLRSSTADLGDGTIVHCWVPRTHLDHKPTLVLLHGIGANAMWQWDWFIDRFIPRFNVYVPDLLFFGDSHTTRPERSESFQARCVMAVMDAHGVRTMAVAGISYGGFVAYAMAAQFKERVERLVLICAGVSLEESDMDNGLFKVKSAEEAATILFPQSPAKLRQLLRLAFFKPPIVIPSCIANDYIRMMCTEHLQERTELVEALHKGRRFSNLAKITQPTMIIWGDEDQVFPVELAHRLKGHLGENARLTILKKTGHAINEEKPKEMYKYMKSFLVDTVLSPKDKPKDSN
ncbi:PREDICTED: monoacylglycerol lipase abhd6-A-like [Tarenaya hassleriana]|uniref:monoacylglycerol lipase abhd6-A-like n=1 Tax=Tarenaya hassleriana TaxID=28532 RepID=UPI00053C73CF|nr:PREDICTED: monoacylglycerol lipase abhd6-A-like [Tarenaya hassleriana]